MTLLIVTSAAPLCAEETIPVPNLPNAGKSPQDFVPKDWAVLMSAEGDLNKDGISDTVLVLKNIHETDIDASGVLKYTDAPRLLAILFKTTQGDYRLSATSAKVILCSTCGGVLGDPFQDLKIDQGVMVIDHYGGSRYRWGYTHRLRYQDGDWYLIGKTETDLDDITLESNSKDLNLITGEEVVEKTNSKGKTTSQHLKVAKKPLQKLSSLDLTK